METLLYGSVVVIAVAFTVLVYHLIRTLHSVQNTLISVSTTMTGIEKQMQGISRETELLLEKTNHLADDLNKKSVKLNSLFDSAKELGESVSVITCSLNKFSYKMKNKVQGHGDKVVDSLNLISWAMDLYRGLQKSRKENKINKSEGSKE